MKVLTFNIRYASAKDGVNQWSRRRDLAFGVAKDGDYDFIGLQEAEPVQVEEFTKALPNYGVWSRSREVDLNRGEACPIFYRTDRWALSDLWAGFVWLSDDPLTPGSKSWGNKIPRIVSWGLFKHKKTGQEVLVLNTHFDHESQAAREKSAEAVLKFINTQRTPGQHVILTGDFNAGEDNAAIKTLKAGFTDAYGDQQTLVDPHRMKHPDEKEVGTFHAFKGGTAGDKIDYVFTLASSKVQVEDAEIIHINKAGRYPSDHYPVSAVLTLPVRKAP